MKKAAINSSIVLLVYLLVTACNSRPKVIEGKPIQAEGPAINSDRQTDMPSTQNNFLDGHLVVVNEILNTEKYSYLHVSESEEKYWIAIPRKEVQVGNTYFYKGGLLKKNFESKEYNRVFETIYLVSDVIPHPLNVVSPETHTANEKDDISFVPVRVASAVGSIKLSELFSDPEKYNGKLILVTGQCVKVNPMIMGRNWVHIRDGSGENLDLTITTTENVSIDAIVSFEGTIALNKDFGAGYRYDVIMETATLR
jgi:hypothetical protein